MQLLLMSTIGTPLVNLTSCLSLYHGLSYVLGTSVGVSFSGACGLPLVWRVSKPLPCALIKPYPLGLGLCFLPLMAGACSFLFLCFFCLCVSLRSHGHFVFTPPVCVASRSLNTNPLSQVFPVCHRLAVGFGGFPHGVGVFTYIPCHKSTNNPLVPTTLTEPVLWLSPYQRSKCLLLLEQESCR